MFTDRFLRIPIKTYHAQTAELTGKKEMEDSFAKILPSDISEYFESTNDSEGTCVQCYTKSGRAFCVEMTIDEFERLLNKHQNE
jgi:hypothetical protein